MIPNGDALWVRLSDGTTHHSPPFVVETMTEDQVRMFLKAKDPVVLIEDDAEDEAPCRAAVAPTSDSDDHDVSRSEEPDASGSEESSNSEESPDDVQNVSEIMDTSTTTALTTSDDSEEFHDCWSAVAQPAYTLPTAKKKPKKKAKQTDKRVRFQADLPATAAHDNVTREECLDFTPPKDLSHPVRMRKEFAGFVTKEALRDATPDERKASKPLPCTMAFCRKPISESQRQERQLVRP
eukprot:2509412-Amphidinium_carterae.1